MIRTKDQLARHLNGGGLIAYEQRQDPEPRSLWSVPQTGEAVHAQAFKWAIANGKLAPLGDGLFEDFTQTFAGSRDA